MINHKITKFNIHRVCLPLEHPIGDSSVKFDTHWITILELFTNDGLSGIGFELKQGRPTAALKQIEEMFEFSSWDSLKDKNPLSAVLSVSHPRGGNIGSLFMPLAIETALWDLAGKMCSMPLYKLLGGKDSAARAYGSTLDYPLTENQYMKKLEKFAALGFKAVKIKVGYPHVHDDIKRLKQAQQVMGNQIDLMADANEAWTVKETMYRINQYLNAGISLYWIEDPILRSNHQGYTFLCQNSPNTRINTGEYVGFSEKCQLLEHHSADVINLDTEINSNRIIAQLADEKNISVSLRNTTMEIGVHLAASLPSCLYIEYSDLSWNKLAQEPVKVDKGYLVAPDKPGHGIVLNREILKKYSRP